eukprot:932580_1
MRAFQLFALTIITLTFGCEWQKIYDGTACYTGDSHGQRYTLSGCLDRCSREGNTYCTFVDGWSMALIIGCGTTSNCCIGSGSCAVMKSSINAVAYQCVPTLTPTKVPINPNKPTSIPSSKPTKRPSKSPSFAPSVGPTRVPTHNPTSTPSNKPTTAPTIRPSNSPSFTPSVMPTNEPTRVPTKRPSRDPTTKPTMNPSRYPTADPSITPTRVPTHHPTAGPTIRPSSSPSFTPSVVPTNEPTRVPTKKPSGGPTTTPTMNPSRYPTVDPSIAPTHVPTHHPTAGPTEQPTKQPTRNPTELPSESPTEEPTVMPTESPTLAPTRFPTMDLDSVYDSWIDVTYILGNISTNYVNEFEDYPLQFRSQFIAVLESNYVVSNVIEYRDFTIIIDKINEFYNIKDTFYLKNDEPIKLESRVRSQANIIGSLFRRTESKAFVDSVRTDLIRYVLRNNSNAFFNVTAVQLNVPKTQPTPADTFLLYAPLIIIAIGILCSIIVCISNELPHNIIKTDNAEFIAPSIYGLQLYDLVTDINLSYHIFTHPTQNTATILCGAFNVGFIVFPFALNVWFALNVSKRKVITDNRAADSYFNNHKSVVLFLLLVVFSAGCHPSLILVSSRVFSLDAFSCGLTTFELSKLETIKLFCTILCEDIPQLIIQIAYSVIISSLTQATVLALTGTLLSIIGTIVIYCKNHKGCSIMHDQQIVQYYIGFKREDAKLSAGQKQSINEYKCSTKALQKAISEALRTRVNNIEIGHISCSNWDVEVYISHCLSKGEVSEKRKYLKEIATVYEKEVDIFYHHFHISKQDHMHFVTEMEFPGKGYQDQEAIIETTSMTTMHSQSSSSLSY